MTTLALALMCLQEDVNTLTLVFEKMHCDECKFEVEARAKKIPGFLSMTFLEATAIVLTAEKATPPVAVVPPVLLPPPTPPVAPVELPPPVALLPPLVVAPAEPPLVATPPVA